MIICEPFLYCLAYACLCSNNKGGGVSLRKICQFSLIFSLFFLLKSFFSDWKMKRMNSSVELSTKSKRKQTGNEKRRRGERGNSEKRRRGSRRKKAKKRRCEQAGSKGTRQILFRFRCSPRQRNSRTASHPAPCTRCLSPPINSGEHHRRGTSSFDIGRRRRPCRPPLPPSAFWRRRRPTVRLNNQ